MTKILIKPSWQFVSATGEHIDPRLFELLSGINNAGKLTLAAKAAGLSYRRAWDLISEWSKFFGSPLVIMQRGKGAALSPLGAKLLWAEQRTGASLFPHMENIASELNLEIGRVTSERSATVIRIHASHGYAVEKLPVLMREQGDAEIDLQYMSSVEALKSLGQQHCDMAGFHVPIDPLGAELWSHYAPWFKGRKLRIIRLVTRTQGLIVAKGNPRKIRSFADLTKPNIRFVNRQRGSGTRILVDSIIKRDHINIAKIHGYDTGEFTHAAVAAFVASGMADVGMGIEPAARQFKIDFIPLIKERYMLACAPATLKQPAVKQLISLVKTDHFRLLAEPEAGYAMDEPGTIVEPAQLFPWA